MNQELRVRRKIRAHIIHNETIVNFGLDCAQSRYRRTKLGGKAARKVAARERSYSKIARLIEQEERS